MNNGIAGLRRGELSTEGPLLGGWGCWSPAGAYLAVRAEAQGVGIAFAVVLFIDLPWLT